MDYWQMFNPIYWMGVAYVEHGVGGAVAVAMASFVTLIGVFYTMEER